jgi:P-type Ca2+ transporter type 2C
MREGSAQWTGLTSEAAARQLTVDGLNMIPQGRSRSVLLIIGEVLREPMLALLLGGGLVYLLLGDLTEALILLAFASFSVIVTVIQETRTEHVLEALRDLSAPRALVIRDGLQLRIAGCDVVREDILVLEQGDRIAADAVLLEANDLQIDESLLTGESLPVSKRAQIEGAELAILRPGGDDQPFVYSGSMIARGNGIARVIATGAQTEIGRIGKSIAELDPGVPKLRQQTSRIVLLCAIGGGAVALLVVALYGLLRGGWLDAVLAGITVGMSMLPEEFPVVLTVFLAMGAWRIGHVNVLTRRAAAIETLGSTTILCSDKTGTLTENRMMVAQLWTPEGGAYIVDGVSDVPDPFAPVLSIGALASAIQAVDPMEIAIHHARQMMPAVGSNNWTLVHSHGLRPELLAMSNLWQIGHQADTHMLAAKGAPEAIASLCKLNKAAIQQLMQAADSMAELGIRVLGVASAETANAVPAASQHDYTFHLVGLIGLADPLRASVPDAVRQCRTAGIKVVMITGDYAKIARSIALQAGIADGDVLTGAELLELDDTGLANRLKSVTIFARIMPEQKLRIVEALKAAGEIVAMTGDGVNDAPSLKAAHIGIAMGKRGTDVAREASAIVLLDDDFGSIVKAVTLGRRIYDNIRKAMAFIFAVHVPIAGLALLPLILGWPILFGPIHIALLEMVIDPVCALVFEAEREEDDIMLRHPRSPDEPLFSLQMIAWSIFQGSLAFILLTTAYVFATSQGDSTPQIRALLFFSLIAVIMALIFANRSFSPSITQVFNRKNSALRFVLIIVAIILAAMQYLPPATKLLRFEPLHWQDIGMAALIGVVLLVVLQALKRIVFHKSRTPV